LNVGDQFAQGYVGYETDAAEYEEVGGIPRATGHDGTPSTFVILATADLTAWSPNGQGGHATMGIYRRGGTVFTAATTDWGNGVQSGDPTVTQITTNVIRRLSERYPGAQWELVGEAIDVTAMCGCQHRLFCVADGQLWWRDPILQNVHWTSIEPCTHFIAMDAPLEGEGKPSIGLFAVAADGGLWFRDQSLVSSPWSSRGVSPGVVALACCYNSLFAATSSNDLLLRKPDWDGPWQRIGGAVNVVAMTNVDGQLFCVTSDQVLWCRLPFESDINWTAIGTVPEPANALAGADGQLFLATTAGNLWVRTARI
jgi:hypothetical protein